MQAGKHFPLAMLADFARGLLEGPERAELQQHLDGGCAECLSQVAWMRSVVDAAQPAPEPPAEVLERARAIMATAPAAPSLPMRVARLVYDSFRDPLPAGIRSIPGAGRQALFEADDYCVDVRIETEAGSNRVALTGQIANSKEPDSQLANLPVLLSQRQRVIQRAETNPQGEFCLEYLNRKNLRVSISVPEMSIVIRLHELQKGD